jgi:hypothetical protein
MGGLVARYYAEVLDHGTGSDRARNTRCVVTIGTPYCGAAKSLALLANGRLTFGPLSVDLSDLARSLPSISELLPTYEVMGPSVADLVAGDRQPTAVQRQELSKITTPAAANGLPEPAWSNCVRFHDEIRSAIEAREGKHVEYRPIVEYIQPTAVWASIESGRVSLHKCADFEDRGDGTVPRWSATPPESSERAAYLTGKHAALQQTRGVYHQLRGILTERAGQPPTLLSPPIVDDQVAAEAPELTEIGEPFRVVAESYEGYESLRLGVAIDDGPPTPMVFDDADGRYHATLPGIAEPGVHQWVVGSLDDRNAAVESVSDLVFATEPDDR